MLVHAQNPLSVDRFQRSPERIKFVILPQCPAQAGAVYPIGSCVAFKAQRNCRPIASLSSGSPPLENVVNVCIRFAAHNAAAFGPKFCDPLHMSFACVTQLSPLLQSQ